ncbi:MAG: hypothetical protein JJ896_10240 [Rhodothermales bacterium]|nr:hypothetical protein [Rhodothermales bacterium]MBO6780019.1 hypothetical protein [Rhodothermales bacterium]
MTSRPAEQGSNPPPLKRWVFGTAAFLLPLVLLLLVEFALSAAGVAEDRRKVFIPVNESGSHLALNPAYVERYFSDFRPGVPFTPFAHEKADSTYRVVTLGGSTTAGFPYRFYNGFPGRLGVLLQAAMPDRHVEVVNLSMSAVTSYTVLDLGRAVLSHDPDVFVVYAGHNEFYGAFGVATTESALANLPWLKRLILRLRKTVLFTLAEGLFQDDRRQPGPSDRTLMARVVREADIPEGGEVFRAGIEQYRQNMSRLLHAAREAGVPVVLGTLVDNLSGQAPLSGGPHADSLFAVGQALLGNGEVDAARDAFSRARDADGLRFRAPGALNQWIVSQTEATVVDLRPVFDAASATGIPGYDLFTDHLHPSARGYGLMAEAFARSVAPEPRIALEPDFGLDDLDRSHADLLLARLLGDYPFVRNPDPDSVLANQRAPVVAALRRGGIDSLAAMIVTGRTQFQTAQSEATALLLAAGDSLSALRSARSLVSWQPLNRELVFRWLRTGLENPALDHETLRLAVLAASRWPDAFSLGGLGVVLLRQGRLDEAEWALGQAEAISPEDPSVLFNTARLLVLSGDTLSAQQYFARYQAVVQN